MNVEICNAIEDMILEYANNSKSYGKADFDKFVGDLKHLIWVYEVEQEIEGK